MSLEIICFDCVGKFCYRCVYEDHRGHKTTPKEEFLEKVKSDRLTL